MKRISIEAWAKREVSVKACYIAIMPNDDGYDLEVEVDQGSIEATYPTGTNVLKKARQAANQLDKALTGMGVKVFKTREEWEEHAMEPEPPDNPYPFWHPGH